MFFRSCDLIFNFLALLKKNAPEYIIIDPSGNLSFLKLCVAKNFFGRTSPR